MTEGVETPVGAPTSPAEETEIVSSIPDQREGVRTISSVPDQREGVRTTGHCATEMNDVQGKEV